MSTNYLKAVFWDYPHLCDFEALKKAINQAKSKDDRETFHWIMARFVERGRFKDTAFLFRPEEIRENLPCLKVTPRAKKRWERFIEVYAIND